MLSVVTIASALFVLGFFITIAFNLHTLLSAMQERIAVEIFLSDGTTKADVASLMDEIRAEDGVRSVQFITKADAMRRFSEKFGTKYIVGLAQNPFPPSILVRLEPGTKLGKSTEHIAQKYRSYSGVTQIASAADVAKKLSDALKSFLILSFIWALILILGALLIVINTIKLAIYGRRETIEVMQLVGATPAFIQRPFTVEGFVQGLLAGIIAAAALQITATGIHSIIAALRMPPPILLYGFVVIGAFFGIIGSRMAVKKFL